MDDAAEQMWARRTDDGLFEICCIPFFTYGIALGDVATWDADSDKALVMRPGGHRVIRTASADRAEAEVQHERLHGALAATGCLVEFNGAGYCAIDAPDDGMSDAALAAIHPFHERHGVSWEWGA